MTLMEFLESIFARMEQEEVWAQTVWPRTADGRPEPSMVWPDESE